MKKEMKLRRLKAQQEADMLHYLQKKLRRIHNQSNRKGFGINEVIGIAAGVIIAAVVIIPGLKLFAGTVMDNLTDWWTTISTSIFTP
jgi:hypothetical protein